jgi:2-phosphosulfolactate phosphatase
VYFDQAEFDLRCEWGMLGLNAVSAGADAIIIVDVLSFSTAVDIAVSCGAAVYPYRWRDDSAKQFATAKRALLAGNRGSADQFSLSPSSLRTIPAGSALVLPSPNGSSLSLETRGVPTFVASLRNAQQVASRAALRGSRIAVIPAGERWPDGSIRPCSEDLVGAGAVLTALPGTKSPEADLAISAFLGCRQNLIEALSRCSSGRELIEMGFLHDVELAAELAVSSTAPVLVDGKFIADLAPPPHQRPDSPR